MKYKKSGYSEEYRARHLEAIQKCEVKELSDEYAALLTEKKGCYEEYKKARKEMLDYQTAKQNVDLILGIG